MKYSLLIVAFAFVGCSPSPAEDGRATEGEGETTSDAPPVSSSGLEPSAGTSSTGGDESSSSGELPGASGASFLDTDTGPSCDRLPDGVLAHCPACRPWSQDCSEGEACKPWANDGGDSWNATRCTPVSDDPDQPGEPCQAEGSATSAVDSCDVGAMCFGVDPETLQGECVALCAGGPDAPECSDGTVCLMDSYGVLPLCLPSCDPLASACDEGSVCFPGQNGEFACMPEIVAPCPRGTLRTTRGCSTICSLAAIAPCDEGFVCSPYLNGGAGDVGVCVEATRD